MTSFFPPRAQFKVPLPFFFSVLLILFHTTFETTAGANPYTDTDKLPALGRSAFIGSVYNSRTQSFTGYSLFHFNATVRSHLDKKYPQLITLKSFTTSTSTLDSDSNSDSARLPLSHTEFKILTKLQDKYDMIGMSPALAVNFLLGKLSPSMSGSAKFLRDEPQTSNSHFWAASLFQKTRACEEILHFDYNSYKNVPPLNLSQFVDWTVVNELKKAEQEQVKELKVVVGIEWGANFAVNIFHPIRGESKEQVENYRREFSMTLYDLAFGSSSNSQITTVKENSKNMRNSSIASKFSSSSEVHIFHDLEEELELEPEGPESSNQNVTFDTVREIMKKTPQILKTVDGGKGVQISYFLYPLEQLIEIIKGQNGQEVKVNFKGQGQVDDQTISSLALQLFEQQNNLNQSILEFKRELERFGARECLNDQVFQLLEQLYNYLKEVTLDFKNKLRMQSFESGSNSNSNSKYNVNLQEFKSALSNLKNSLDGSLIKNARRKLKVFKMFRKDRKLHYLGRSLESTQAEFVRKIQEDVGSRKIAYVFIYKSELERESAESTNKKNTRGGKVAKGSKARRSGLGKSLWSKNLHLFTTILYQSHNKRFVLDCDFHPKLVECSDVNSTTIRQYRRGVLTSADCLKRINFKVKESQRIRQKAIGRFPRLGDLFNAQTELFTGTSIFKKSLNSSSKFIKKEKYAKLKKNVSVIPGNATLEEKFKALKIFDSNVQLGIASESIPLENSGLFFKSVRMNSNSSSSSNFNEQSEIQKSLLFTLNSGKAILDLSSPNLGNSLDFFRLTDPNTNKNPDSDSESAFTHFVKEIEIGQVSIFSTMQKGHGDLDILKEALLKFPFANVTDYFEFDKLSTAESSSKFLLYSDTLGAKKFENITQVLEKMREIQNLFLEEDKNSESLIQPISFLLEPIETLQKPFGVVTSHREYQRLKNREDEMISWSMEIFDAIQGAEKDLEDLKGSIEKYKACLDSDSELYDLEKTSTSSWKRLQNVQVKFEQDATQFKREFQETLVHIKSNDSGKWSELENVIEDFLRDGKFHFNFKLAALDQFESEQENIELCEKEQPE